MLRGLTLCLLLLILTFLSLTSSIIVAFCRTSAYGRAGGSSAWETSFEGVSSSRYSFHVGDVANAVKLVLYMDSSGDVNSDWVKVIVYGDVAAVPDPSAGFRRYLVGYSRIGYENDGKGTARGLHVVYYILPETTYLDSVELELHSERGFPKLDTARSWVEPLNMTTLYWAQRDEGGTYGTTYMTTAGAVGNELRVAALSCGTRGCPASHTSSISAYHIMSFVPDMGGVADIYFDVGYMGGFNIAPVSFAGGGKYRIKLDVGVEQASSLDKIVSDQDFVTLFYLSGGEGLPELATRFVEGRVEDVLLDLITDYGAEFVTSAAGKAVLKSIPFIAQIVEWAEIFWSLGYDEIVNGSRRVVLNNTYIDYKSGERVNLWTHFVGIAESTLLSSNIINFCGEPPWQNFLDTYFGNRVWRLDHGGVHLGGVVLDYFNVPEVISELPQGGVYRATDSISVVFDKSISEASLPPHDDSIAVRLNGVGRPFLEYFRYRLSRNNTVLLIYPNYHLEYGSTYVIELTQRIRGSDGTNIVKPYVMWFSTEERAQTVPPFYYVMPTATAATLPDHLTYQGKVFSAYLYGNASIDWSGAGLSEVPLYVDGRRVSAKYVGEAVLYTNDINVDYYDGGSGRLYLANGTLLFTPLSGWDGGYPPKRGLLVFRLGGLVNVVKDQPARLAVSWVRVGNPNVERSLRNAGIVEGALLDLEPVPFANYALISSVGKVGEGVVLSGRDHRVNGSRLALYLVTVDDRGVHGLAELLGNYTPMYKVGLGGSVFMDADVFVFVAVNSSIMAAWRLAPYGYVSQIEQSKVYTYTIKLLSPEPVEIIITTNTSVKELDKSKLPSELRLVVEGEVGGAGYAILAIPKQLNMVVSLATVDGRPATIERIDQTTADVVLARIAYKLTQESSTLSIYLSKEVEPGTRTPAETSTAGPQSLPGEAMLAIASIALAVAALVILKSRK
ncbi:MAG: Ig-like domain-containing protein [Zestosphaera sp.]